MIAFGPVTSRRLGLSLGINNIKSRKACSYACVYCQVGQTHSKTMVRVKQFEPERLYRDIVQYLKKLDSHHKPDYLTFVANGEPTLDINLGEEIELLKQLGVSIAVITNASLINKADVRNDLLKADWVSVKIDTVDKSTWIKTNRPKKEFSLNLILKGVQQFANDFQGKLCTETMLIEGYNDDSKLLESTASFISTLSPFVSYLSIPTRPPAISNVQAVSETKITEAWKIYQQNEINTELITGFEGTDTGFTGDISEDILRITSVHPLREDTVAALIKNEHADIEAINSLVNKGLIKNIEYHGNKYYVRNYHGRIK